MMTTGLIKIVFKVKIIYEWFYVYTVVFKIYLKRILSSNYEA